MAAKATRCPHCQTVFRVTDAQLETAGGLVRCGACLEVFTATEHWIEPNEADITPDSSDVVADEDEILFDDDNGLPGGEDETDSTAEPIIAGTPAEEDWPEVDGGDTYEEAIVAPFIGDELPELDELDTFEEPDLSYNTATSDATPHIEPALPHGEDKSEGDEFDQLVYQHKRQLRLSRQQLGWSLLTLLAAFLLAAQIITANFNRIAQSDYRPQLANLCNVINFFGRGQHCQLPPPQNLALVNSRGLNIYSHPKFANSLLVDALIENQAVFAQPFPVIELEFYDQHGRTVAARHFQPYEYLAGELSNAELMPSQQTIHINIAILDPGSMAVNYEMRFHPGKG